MWNWIISCHYNPLLAHFCYALSLARSWVYCSPQPDSSIRVSELVSVLVWSIHDAGWGQERKWCQCEARVSWVMQGTLSTCHRTHDTWHVTQPARWWGGLDTSRLRGHSPALLCHKFPRSVINPPPPPPAAQQQGRSWWKLLQFLCLDNCGTAVVRQWAGRSAAWIELSSVIGQSLVDTIPAPEGRHASRVWQCLELKI